MKNLKKLICLILCCVFLISCEAEAEEAQRFESERHFRVISIECKKKAEFVKGFWVTQFDMHTLFRDGSKQRDRIEYTRLAETMLNNIVSNGFNTVILQVRPNGDSMVKSDIYPYSKYIAGVYGGYVDYDAVEIFVSLAKERKLSIHAWINPYRLCGEDELIAYGNGILYDWYREGIGKRIELGADGLLYLDPSYEEAVKLIASGAKEILENYDFDGIHIDDYFYPTEFEFNDSDELKNSDSNNLSEFRISNTDKLIRALYEAVHGFDGKLFGVSPAGNIYSLKGGWYIDIYKWLSEDGYVDYVMPQLYFGFKNEKCPFDRVLNDWMLAVKNEAKIYIGISAAKCELGSSGVADAFAGESGYYEWRDEKDILARSYAASKEIGADGVCVFSYSSFFDLLTGENNEKTLEEYKNLQGVICS